MTNKTKPLQKKMVYKPSSNTKKPMRYFGQSVDDSPEKQDARMIDSIEHEEPTSFNHPRTRIEPYKSGMRSVQKPSYDEAIWDSSNVNSN
jgi:hypothetical protein